MIFNFDTKEMIAYGNALKATTTDADKLIELTGSLTLEQTKNVLIAKKANTEDVKRVLASRNLTKAEIESTAATIAKAGATTTVSSATNAYTTALLANAKAMALSIVTNPVTWIMGIVGAITLAVNTYKKFNPTIEEQKTQLDELKESYTALKDEVSSLSDEITKNNERIVELQDKLNNNTITLVEEDELNKLRLENSLLQQQLTIKEDLEKLKHKEVVDKSVETFSNEFGDYKEPKELSNPNDVSDRYLLYMEDYKEIDNQSLLLLIKENKERLKDAMFSGDEDLSEWMQKDQENLEVLLNERLLALNEYQTDLSKVRNSDGTFDDESYQHAWDEIEKWEKDFYDTSNRSGEWNTIQIEAALNTESLQSIQNELRQKLADGNLTEEDLEGYTELNEALKNSNMILTDSQNPLSVYLDYLHGLSPAQAELNEAIENMPNLSFEEILEQLEESHTSLTDLEKEINETKVISVDTIQDLMSKYPSLTNLLSDYVEGKAKEKDVIDALADEYATDLENYRLYIIQKHGKDEEFYDEVIDNLSEDLIKKAESYGIELGNYSNYLEAKLAMDKEYARKKAILESAKEIYENSITDPAYRFNPSIAAYDDMVQAEEDVKAIEEIINGVDTSIKVVVPDFNTDLFKGDDKPDEVKEFSESIDWAANSISNLEREISKLNDTISNTTDIDKKIELLKDLKEKQIDLATLKGETEEKYKEQYENSLKELTPAQRKKYQKLIESNKKAKIEDFEGENKEELYKKVTNSQSLWGQYQQSITDHDTAEQDVKDTEKLISDTDVLERSKLRQKDLEKELDTVNEKLNDSTLSAEKKNELLKQQYDLQKSINDELRIQAKHEDDTETVKKLDAEDKNNKHEYDTDVYNSDKDELLLNVDKNNNTITDIQNAIDLSGKGTKQQYLDIIDLQEKNIEQWKTQRDKALALRDANKDNLVLYQYWDNELQDCENNIHDMESGIKEMQTAILNLPLQEVEEKLKSINKELDSHNRDLEEQNELISAAIAYFDAEIETQNLIKESIQDKIDALQEEHDLREANLNIQKAQWELEKARNNKSVKVFKEGVGFVFEADTEEVQNAQLNYDNAIYERKQQLLNDEIKKVDKQIESLSKQKKEWEDITVLSERTALFTKAMAYDTDFRNKVLSGDVGLLTTIRDRYGEIYSKVNELEELKKPYELLQEELTDISQTFSLGGLSYEDALARTETAISQYYPELLKTYDEQGTSLEEVAKKQLESVGITEESSEKNKEQIKNTNEEITQSYNDLLKDLTDVFERLETLMSNLLNKANSTASSVRKAGSAISSAISNAGSVTDNGLENIDNSISDKYKKLDDETVDEYNRISNNLKTIMPTIATVPVKNTTPSVTTTNNNKSTNITFGDIVVNDVKDSNDFAKTIVKSLSSAMKQELYK